MTTARTLAQVLDVPVVGIPSPDLVAYPWRTTHRRLVALIDARRKEVFAARYRPFPGGVQRDGDYTVEAPDAIAAELLATGTDTLLVGDGALVYADMFTGLDHVELGGPAAAAPSVSALVELATVRFERGEFCRPRPSRPSTSAAAMPRSRGTPDERGVDPDAHGPRAPSGARTARPAGSGEGRMSEGSTPTLVARGRRAGLERPDP